MAKLSIIITVYNLEKYIEKCLRSVMEQQYTDIEIIVVNDGSIDNSGIICNKLAIEDDRIIVVHKNNAGRVLARRTGVENSNSEYIAFVDGDDWIEPDMYIDMMANATSTSADLIVSGYIQVKNGNCIKKFTSIKPGTYSIDEEMDYIRKNLFCYNNKNELGIYSSMCTNIYKKNIIGDIFFVIPNDLYMGEDFLFNGLYISKCKSVSIMDKAYYNYLIHENSTVARKCPDLFLQLGYIQQKLSMVYDSDKDILESIKKRSFFDFIRLWNFENEDDFLHVPYYALDFSWIENKSVALYGAGAVGRDYHWIMKKTYPKVLKTWVDKNFLVAQENGLEVEGIERLKEWDYDVILIAVESEQVANEIKVELSNEFGICEDKLVWHKPKFYWI
ncbi:MAG: glycosyltransferase family 2 protein [Lachnospirales bacterium]